MTLLEQMKISTENMSMGDRFLASLQVTLLGVAIVFIALFMLFIIIKILERFVHQAESGSAKRKAAKESTAAGSQPAPPEPAPAEEETDPGELIAVISAAIAASQQTSMHNIVVRQITRMPDTVPAWNRLGRIQQLNRRPR